MLAKFLRALNCFNLFTFCNKHYVLYYKLHYIFQQNKFVTGKKLLTIDRDFLGYLHFMKHA